MQGERIGLGDTNARLQVFIGHQPNLPSGFKLKEVVPLSIGELTDFVAVNSNHWRKVFNVYAKLCFALYPNDCASWQAYRDHHLMQKDEGHALIFSPWQAQHSKGNTISLICGKTHAMSLNLLEQSQVLDDGFFLNSEANVLITPYFDYRAFSDRKVAKSADLIRQYFSH